MENIRCLLFITQFSISSVYLSLCLSLSLTLCVPHPPLFHKLSSDLTEASSGHTASLKPLNHIHCPSYIRPLLAPLLSAHFSIQTLTSKAFPTEPLAIHSTWIVFQPLCLSSLFLKPGKPLGHLSPHSKPTLGQIKHHFSQEAFLSIPNEIPLRISYRVYIYSS